VPERQRTSEPATERRSQEQRRTEAEGRLLEAAAELIGKVGPSRVTLAAIGERAGYSRGLVNHHFGSKAVLMQRLVEVAAAEFADAVRTATDPGAPIDELLGLVRAFTGMVANLAPIHRAFLVLWADALATSPEIAPTMIESDRAFRDAIAEVVRRGRAGGEFSRTVDPAGFAAVLLGMLRGVALQSILDTSVDVAASRAEIERLLRAALTSST
jgi:AcrR family transcriptional regulator